MCQRTVSAAFNACKFSVSAAVALYTTAFEIIPPVSRQPAYLVLLAIEMGFLCGCCATLIDESELSKEVHMG